MVRVKICGITRLEDALCAELAGAHALGFIFYKKSKRYVKPSSASAIIEKLNPLTIKTGVFVNESIDVINKITTECGLTHVQLHGEEMLDFARSVNRPVIKALNFDDNIEKKMVYWKDYPILIDSGSAILPGGTGIPLPWEKLKTLNIGKKIILAGGLNPENIAGAVKILNPLAVDVSSGVENKPGIKNSDLIWQFLNNINKINKVNK